MPQTPIVFESGRLAQMLGAHTIARTTTSKFPTDTCVVRTELLQSGYNANVIVYFDKDDLQSVARLTHSLSKPAERLVWYMSTCCKPQHLHEFTDCLTYINNLLLTLKS